MLIVAGSVVQAQQQAKIPKIGLLGVRPDDSKTTFELLRQQLQALGYVDGKTIVFEYRNAENNRERLPALVADIIPFTCVICGLKFSELSGRKCSNCGRLACRYHFLWGWLKGSRGVCSLCLRSGKPNAEKK